eukprot:SAG22_NODE_1314_length_4773_cov_3.303594_3_plen_116_part_00
MSEDEGTAFALCYHWLSHLRQRLSVRSCAKTAVSVMCAYNGINGSPMCMSPMIQGVLRDQFNFSRRPENYVVTDSGAPSAGSGILSFLGPPTPMPTPAASHCWLAGCCGGLDRVS